jgi:hypothetical protein
MAEMTSISPPLPGSEQVICSLCEGDYHIGVAALINSLVRNGFTGLFWIGHRGDLPPWISQLARREDGLFQVGNALLGFETVTARRHFGQYKPEFLSSVIDRGIARKHIWYIEPDITIRCEWNFYERWVRYGVCLCQDLAMSTMSSRHPFRCEWADMARTAGWGEPVQQQERYYNSGFVGLDVVHVAFLQKWIAAVHLANSDGVAPGDFQKRRRPQLFSTVDQDAMNIATMYSAVPLSTMGPEAMGFESNGFTMFHAVSKPKAWKKKFISSALRGIPPSYPEKHFLECASGPIQPFSRSRLARLRLSTGIGILMTRFYRKG